MRGQVPGGGLVRAPGLLRTVVLRNRAPAPPPPPTFPSAHVCWAEFPLVLLWRPSPPDDCCDNPITRHASHLPAATAPSAPRTGAQTHKRTNARACTRTPPPRHMPCAAYSRTQSIGVIVITDAAVVNCVIIPWFKWSVVTIHPPPQRQAPRARTVRQSWGPGTSKWETLPTRIEATWRA